MQIERDQWLTIAEVAAKFRVSDALITREIHRGRIPFIKIGRSYRIKSDWVLDQIMQFGTTPYDGEATLRPPSAEDVAVRVEAFREASGLNVVRGEN